MGGEWEFNFVGDKESFDHAKYHEVLQKIKSKYVSKDWKTKEEGTVVTWAEEEGTTETEASSSAQASASNETAGNKFAEFSYKDSRYKGWGKPNKGWALFLDPTVGKAVTQSNVHARSAPSCFIRLSVEIQKTLAKEFPKHFQLYLGDGVSGVGPECHQYWGAAPDDWTGGYDGSEDFKELTREVGRLGLDYHDDDADFYTTKYGFREPKDFRACSSECGYCGTCMDDYD